MSNTFADLETKLGLTFKDPKIIELAFVHRSYLNENKAYTESNERLEFLGDAIISFIVALNLYRQFPKANEGDLTNYRASLVSRKFLGNVGKNWELGRYLHLAKGEEDADGRNNMTVLSNTCEALIGAIYLDQGIESVAQIVETFVLSAIEDIISNKAYRDHKSALQELVQSLHHKPPVYRVVKEEGPEHAKIFFVEVSVNNDSLGEGQGKSKQEAEQHAANAALDHLQKA